MDMIDNYFWKRERERERERESFSNNPYKQCKIY